MHPLHDAVTALIHAVARDVVMPYFRNLGAGQVEEKEPDDLVTIADRESELRLTEGLRRIDPAARIIGEEATAADASVLDGIGDGRVWLIDPIDGTNNYAHGRTPFAIMLALLENGVAVAGWIYDPVTGRMCHALRGEGAFIDGERVTAHASGDALPRAAIGLHFMTDDQRDDASRRAAGHLTMTPTPRCAGAQYPQIVLGEVDAALFQRMLPWDHAAGSLFVIEAGGICAYPDGTPYSAADMRPGMLVATSQALWDEVRGVLFE